MDDLIIRKATIEELNDIVSLNNKLFKLEKENYDDTLVENWPLSEEGKEYFKDLIINQFVIVATINNKIYNIKVEASYKNRGAIEFYHRTGFIDFNLTLTSKLK